MFSKWFKKGNSPEAAQGGPAIHFVSGSDGKSTTIHAPRAVIKALKRAFAMQGIDYRNAENAFLAFDQDLDKVLAAYPALKAQLERDSKPQPEDPAQAENPYRSPGP